MWVKTLEKKLGMDAEVAFCALYVVALLVIFGGLMAIAASMHSL